MQGEFQLRFVRVLQATHPGAPCTVTEQAIIPAEPLVTSERLESFKYEKMTSKANEKMAQFNWILAFL